MTEVPRQAVTAAALNLSSFKTVFDDNFTQDTSVDHALWTDSWGESDQFSFSSKTGLTLTGYEKPYWNPVAVMQHTVGNSAGEGYGLYQFSGYGNAGQGVGICFIMWRADNKYLDASTPGKATEIDILESWDKTSSGQSTIHYYDATQKNDNGQGFHQINISPAQPHTYSMDWERGSLTFYVDGVQEYQDTTHAPLDAADGGSNEVMGAQVINEAPLVTTPTVQLHITDMSYSAPITQAPSSVIFLGIPGTMQEASASAGVTVAELVAAPTLTGTVYAEVLTAAGKVETPYQAAILGLHHTVTIKLTVLESGDVIKVVNSLTNPTATATSSAVTITDAAVTSGGTISLSAPGTVQEVSAGAGVTVTETMTSTNLTGTVYEEVLTSSGAVETAFQAVTVAAGGSTRFSVHLAGTGDVVKVVNSKTAPTISATSSAVTITDLPPPPATLAISAPGTVREASAGAGVTVTETITARNLTGTVYAEILTSSGAVETGYKAVVLSSAGTAATTIHFAKTGDVVKVVNSTTDPTVSATSAAITLTDSVVTQLLTASLPSPLFIGTDTVTGKGGVAGLQLERITQGTYNEPGLSGWVKATVASDGSWTAQLAFTKPGMLAHVYAENGGSKTVVDLVNGTPTTPPVKSVKAAAATMHPATLSDMAANGRVTAASPALLPAASPSAAHGGTWLDVAGAASAVPVVTDHGRHLVAL